MRNFYIFILNFFFIYTGVNAQKTIDITVWEANTITGGKFIGITRDTYEAEVVIDELKYEFEGTKYAIDMVNTTEASYLVDNPDVSIIESFVSDHDALKYKYISEMELIALQYMDDNSPTTGIRFYMNVSSIKSEAKAKFYLETLYTNYAKYLFNLQTPAMLVSYSE